MGKTKRIIEDLHGGVFSMETDGYTITHLYPSIKDIIGKQDSTQILTRDIITNTQFILIQGATKFGYIFYENQVYVSGLLQKVAYKKENDIRCLK